MEKANKVKEKIDTHDFNFAGARLFEINFSGKRIEGNLILSGSKIINSVRLNGSTINGNVSLTGAEVDGILFFDSQYDPALRTIINGSLLLQGSHIHQGAFFRNIEIRDDLKLWNTTMGSFVRSANAKIGGQVWILNSTFGNFLEFSGATIGKFFQISRSSIDGFGYFHGTKFKGDVSFKGTVFKIEVDFCRSKFFENITFEDVEFIKNVYFRNVLFNGIVYFIQKHITSNIFRSYVSFADSSFFARGIFEGIKNLNASFRSARLKNVVFRNCDLSNVRFKDVIFDNCELSTSKLPDKIIEHKEHDYSAKLNFKLLKLSSKMTILSCPIFSPRAQFPCKTIIAIPDKVENANMVSDIYRRIRQCLESQGAYIEASDYYKKEMDMRREVYKSKNTINWIFYSFLSLISRYGENSKILVVLISLYYVLLLTIVYFFKINPTNPLFIYFNIAIIPLGSFLIALFVYVFARKMSR
jgi:uncharacterized protein YjbI with pentapeptide repeats